MKSLIDLYAVLSIEIERRCCTSATVDSRWSPINTRRDLGTIDRRVKCEGLSFLTISLPIFGKDFERSLDQGRVSDDMFRGFSKHAGLPKFLGWALRRIFDPCTGQLIQNPCIESIAGIRQLTLMFSKLEIDCTDERVAKAYDAYLECENEVKRHIREGRHLSYVDDLSRASRVLFGGALSVVDRSVYHLDLIPKHGPGATADGLMGNQKFRQTKWHSRLEVFFPSLDYLVPSHRFISELDAIDFVEPGDELPVKVTHVPKTLKTPRLIAEEPTCMMYAQQALKQSLVSAIEGDKTLGQMLHFMDQEPNRVLARHGSRYNDYATLDLSEASDRVSVEHVKALLKGHPETLGAALAARSTHARVRNHGVIPLAKYASMGSALTFPMEAMVFLAAVFVGIAKELNCQVDHALVKRYRDHVRVYGDDIIVPAEFVHSVIATLELFGFKVNASKSFWTGKFRESCGGDYYDGYDVKFVKVTRMISYSPRNVDDFVSTIALRNKMYMSGYWGVAKWMDQRFKERNIPYPTVYPTSPALGRHSVLGYESHKMDENLHSPLVKGLVQFSQPPKNNLEGHAALLKFFLKRGNEPHTREHLERSGRPRSSSIKTRWTSPF